MVEEVDDSKIDLLAVGVVVDHPTGDLFPSTSGTRGCWDLTDVGHEWFVASGRGRCREPMGAIPRSLERHSWDATVAPIQVRRHHRKLVILRAAQALAVAQVEAGNYRS